jgi:hypothetical protein
VREDGNAVEDCGEGLMVLWMRISGRSGGVYRDVVGGGAGLGQRGDRGAKGSRTSRLRRGGVAVGSGVMARGLWNNNLTLLFLSGVVL